MTSIPEQISGSETGHDGALAALIAFYRGFNARDLNDLSETWLDGAEPSMSNPIGGLRRGWPAIREGYARLFQGPACVTVAFHDFTMQGDDHACLFVGREKGRCTWPGGEIALRIRTTRWFVRTDGIWRQLHHHGSMEEPALLAAYQRSILGAEQASAS